MMVLSKLKELSSMFGILNMIWLILLGICGLIALVVAPIPGDNTYFMNLLISAGKVAITAVGILFWLISWYKLMQMALVYDLSKVEQ